MRRPLIAGNWKMNGSTASNAALLSEVATKAADITTVDWLVCPSFVYLDQTATALTNTNVAWGAQNISEQEAGAYTGEVSASMLVDFHCRYVLVGHSERRQLYGESSSLVAKKFAAVQAKGMLPILCMGETLEQREVDKTLEVVFEQIDAVLALEGGVSVFQEAVIAYEPVWAIGTGKTATPEEAQAVHAAIREKIAKHDESIAKSLRILYGGSVKPDNAALLFSMPDLDGALIGGASLKAKDFLDIGRCAKG